jgi:hypothetical protein
MTPTTRSTPRHRADPRRAAVLDALVLFLLSLLSACADAGSPTAPARAAVAPRALLADPTRPRQTEATRQRLEEAAAGLLYTSESDYPFDYVFFAADAAPPLDAATFRAAAAVPADAAVEERTLDDFFARHIERVDPNDSAAVALVPRYERLKRTIRTSVRDARVFRVGTIAIRCYVVGVDPWGNVVGLATTAIET